MVEPRVWAASAAVLALWALAHRRLCKRRKVDAVPELVTCAKAVASIFPAPFIVMGHTHVPARERLRDAVTYINVGAWAEDEGTPPAPRSHLVIHPAEGGAVAHLLRWDRALGPTELEAIPSTRAGDASASCGPAKSRLGGSRAFSAKTTLRACEWPSCSASRSARSAARERARRIRPAPPSGGAWRCATQLRRRVHVRRAARLLPRVRGHGPRRARRRGLRRVHGLPLRRPLIAAIGSVPRSNRIGPGSHWIGPGEPLDWSRGAIGAVPRSNWIGPGEPFGSVPGSHWSGPGEPLDRSGGQLDRSRGADLDWSRGAIAASRGAIGAVPRITPNALGAG